MKILFVEPGKEAQPAEIQGDLKEMQAIVGGRIEALYPWADPVALICNDEGKLLRLPLNRMLEDWSEEKFNIVLVVKRTRLFRGSVWEEPMWPFPVLSAAQLERAPYYERKR